MNIVLNKGERLDDLHRNGYKIIQNPESFCFGVDAVLLSAFCRAEKTERIIDLGTGNGIIPILLAAKTKSPYICGIDICPESVDMAKRSVDLNNLNDRIDISLKDIKEVRKFYEASSFEVVVSNPPYMKPNSGILNSVTQKAAARHEIFVTLSDVPAAAKWLLKFSGRLYMVHRPNRLADIFCLMRENSIEPKILRLVLPFSGKPPNMALIMGSKGGKPGLDVMPPLIIYERQNVYTKEVYDMYYN